MEINNLNNQTVLSMTISDELVVKMNKLDLIVTVSEVGDDYKSAMKNGSEKNKKILDMFQNLQDSFVKVKSVTVEPIIDNIEEIKKSNIFGNTQEIKKVKKVIGYSYRSIIVLTFDAYSEAIVDSYTKLITSGLIDNVTHNYYLDDEESNKDLLLINLVEKAKKQAEIISSGFGYKIDRICSIDKSVSKVTINYSSQSSFSDYDEGDFDCCLDDCFEDFVSANATSMFNPDDIQTRTFSDSLNISFILEKK